MDPRAFLALAESLAKGPGPAEHRTAINRAYYAAYNYAIVVLESIGLTIPRTAQGHGEVRELLENAPGRICGRPERNWGISTGFGSARITRCRTWE